MNSPEDEIEELDDYEEQVEQLILENGMLLHAVVNVLVRNGVISRDELDGEIESLYRQVDDGLTPPTDH